MIAETRNELGTKISSNYIGVHIRRGDHKAKFTKGPEGYVPFENFVNEVKGVKERFFAEGDTMMVYLASDDPSAIESFESLISESLSPSLGSIQTFSLYASTSPVLRALASPKAYVQAEFDALHEDKVMLTRGVIVDMALVSGLWMEDGDDDGKMKPDAVVCTIG